MGCASSSPESAVSAQTSASSKPKNDSTPTELPQSQNTPSSVPSQSTKQEFKEELPKIAQKQVQSPRMSPSPSPLPPPPQEQQQPQQQMQSQQKTQPQQQQQQQLEQPQSQSKLLTIPCPTGKNLTKKTNDEEKKAIENSCQEITLKVVKEPERKIGETSQGKLEPEPAPEPEPDFLHLRSNQQDDSSDDGSELSRDSFEGNIVTNTPSAVRSDDGSVSSSTHTGSFVGKPNTDKVTVISSKEEFIYEYERWQPFVQWGQTNPGHMLPSDPGIYSDLEGTKFGNNTDDVAPSHPKWWHVITPFEPVSRDEDPWEYSVDFRNYEWYPSKQKKSFVRRRKLRRRVGDSRLHQTSLPQSITSFSSSSIDQNPPSTVKGNIKKSGGKLQAFNDRYFVLESSGEGSYLIYYLKYTDSPPFGTNERDRMNLKHCQLTTSSEGHVILTSKKGKTYVLDLQDHPDQEKWIQALNDHINYANRSEHSK